MVVKYLDNGKVNVVFCGDNKKDCRVIFRDGNACFLDKKMKYYAIPTENVVSVMGSWIVGHYRYGVYTEDYIKGDNVKTAKFYNGKAYFNGKFYNVADIFMFD